MAEWLRERKGISTNSDIGVPLVGVMVDEGPMLPILMLGKVFNTDTRPAVTP